MQHKFCFEQLDPITGEELKCQVHLFGKRVERCPRCSFEFEEIRRYRQMLMVASEMGLDPRSSAWPRHPYEDVKQFTRSNKQHTDAAWTRREYRKYMKTKHRS